MTDRIFEEKRRTIVYIGGFELPDKNAAAHRVLAIGMILRELGYNVVFIGVDSSRTNENELLREDYYGFECWSVPYPTGTTAWIRYTLGLDAVLSFLRQDLSSSSVSGVICYNYPALAQLRIARVCRSIGAKILSDATEWYDTSAGSLAYRTVKGVDTFLRMRVVHGLADGVITTSKYLTDIYQKKGGIVVEIPTLFNTEKFKPPPARDQRSKTRFIYVGSPFNIEKINSQRSNLKERLDLCVEVFHQLHMEGKEFRFEIYGICQNDYLKVFPEHKEMLRDMFGVLVFRGKQPNEYVIERIANSDFSIFFRDETRVTKAGFPSKLAESISCGTPVICNAGTGARKQSSDGVLFIADQGYELSLVRSVLKIPANDMNRLKWRAYKSRAYDYRNYLGQVSRFMNKVGI